MDVLTSIMKTVRLAGTVFCTAEVEAPWSVHTRGLPSGIFHAVVRGSCTLVLDDDDTPYVLKQGDVVFLPFGDAHVMCDSPSTEPVPIVDMVETKPGQSVGSLKIEGWGEATSIICGSFSFEQSEIHPLLSNLPPVIVVRKEEGDLASWLASTLELMSHELQESGPGAEIVLTRLADVILVYALRKHIDSLPPGEGGWLGALRDPQLSKALGHIHHEPDERWTAGSLATKVGMSRSAFFSRFSEMVGEPPGQYLTRWRMHLATQALKEDSVSLAEVAFQVGYNSESSFSKAFKRIVGQSPSIYRKDVLQ